MQAMSIRFTVLTTLSKS